MLLPFLVHQIIVTDAETKLLLWNSMTKWNTNLNNLTRHQGEENHTFHEELQIITFNLFFACFYQSVQCLQHYYLYNKIFV
mmetsp:Transcript_58938/g.88921  ORF Transcript_58938/g.88921 Transcript_58938/m.88921 type:complete len:81 (+) Transcript_58938:764-1006(+)